MRERGRGAEKCVSEHWVTPLLNLSTSKVSPQGWGLDGSGQGVVRGKVSGGRVREKGERLHSRVQSEVRRLGKQCMRNSVCGNEGQKKNLFLMGVCASQSCAPGETSKILNNEYKIRFNFPKASQMIQLD